MALMKKAAMIARGRLTTENDVKRCNVLEPHFYVTP
jgi:hypothetical protein